MRLTTKGRFAVTAVLDLATHGANGPVTLTEISERQGISLSYLEQLFGRMRRGGLVKSTRGPGGGYRLADAMSTIPVAKIIAAVDEELQFTRCDGDAVEGCVKGERCNAHDLWSSLGRQMMAFLSSISLEDVVEKRNLALAATIKQTKDRHPEGQPA